MKTKLYFLPLAIAGLAATVGLSTGCSKGNTELSLRERADTGDVAAMVEIGAAFHYGDSATTQNTDSAIFWYAKAAGLNSPAAMDSLAGIYASDKLGVQDYAKAMEWYTKAAEFNDSIAIKHLAFAYYLGDLGQNKDYVQAVKWCQRGADLGYADCKSNLGVLYLNGHGVPKDKAKGLALLEEAGVQNSQIALFNLGQLYRYGTLGIGKDVNKAVAYFQKGSDLGYSDCMDALGCCYMDGVGVPQDKAKGLEYFKKAAATNNISALKHVGYVYWIADGVEKDMEIAKDCYRKAAAAGDEWSQGWLGYHENE